jgi:hypothetical protein
MRLIAVVLAAVTIGGCASNSYRIPQHELARLSQVAPDQRGREVRVVQELSATHVNNAERVGPDTQVVIVPQIHISTGPRYSRDRYGGGVGGGSGGSGGGKGVKVSGGSGSDGKAAAIAVIVVAVAALFIVAGIEGSRFDGFAEVHPMHPVHLIGKDGGYTIMPLAWIDPDAAAWAEKAIIRPTEGPWRNLRRAPLWREGWTYGLYAGTGTLYSAHGDSAPGPAFTLQLGYFPTQHIGILADVMFGWRQNRLDDTLFESRYMLELQALPLRAGILHAGGYVAAGRANRFEDNVMRGNAGTAAYTAGGMLQLDVNTRIALTARAGVTRIHDQRTADLVFGMSVY